MPRPHSGSTRRSQNPSRIGRRREDTHSRYPTPFTPSASRSAAPSTLRLAMWLPVSSCYPSRDFLDKVPTYIPQYRCYGHYGQLREVHTPAFRLLGAILRVFCPTGATSCTDGVKFWHGLIYRAKFNPIAAWWKFHATAHRGVSLGQFLRHFHRLWPPIHIQHIIITTLLSSSTFTSSRLSPHCSSQIKATQKLRRVNNSTK